MILGTASFDESYRVLDDIASTPYEDWFYFVPEGTVLEPIVKDENGNVLGPECYKASYNECTFYDERNEWDQIDENAWFDEFPTKAGVYICIVEGVAPYTGSFEWIDLIRITPSPVPDDTFDWFYKVAGWYSHEWFAEKDGFKFCVPCRSVAAGTEYIFTKDDLDKIEITVTTADGKVYEPTVTEDPDYEGDYIYSYDTPAQDWGAGYTISFKNGDTVKTMEGTVKKETVISIKASDLKYTGSKLAPKVTVKADGKTLAEGTDYEFSSDMEMDIKNVGFYGIYVESPLTSKYSIHDIAAFKVNPKGTTLSKPVAAKKGFTVKWKKQAKQTTGYQIQYSTSSTFKKGSQTKTVTISKTKTVSKKITKLKAKKKYYVRIRTYKKVNGQPFYSAWSSKKSVKTK